MENSFMIQDYPSYRFNCLSLQFIGKLETKWLSINNLRGTDGWKNITIINPLQLYYYNKYDTPGRYNDEFRKLILLADSYCKIISLGKLRIENKDAGLFLNKKEKEYGKVRDLINRYKNKVTVREDWMEIRLSVMKIAIQLKYKYYRNKFTNISMFDNINYEMRHPHKRKNNLFWGTETYTNMKTKKIEVRGENHMGKIMYDIIKKNEYVIIPVENIKEVNWTYRRNDYT